MPTVAAGAFVASAGVGSAALSRHAEMRRRIGMRCAPYRRRTGTGGRTRRPSRNKVEAAELRADIMCPVSRQLELTLGPQYVVEVEDRLTTSLARRNGASYAS